MRNFLMLVAVSVLIAACQVHGEMQESSFSCDNFFTFNGSVEMTRKALASNPEDLAWNWFGCLNQPTGLLSMNRVWENLKPTDQVFLADGSEPLPYAQREPVPAKVIEIANTQKMGSGRIFHNLESTQQVDGLILEMGGAVPASQKGLPVRYQLLMWQDTFNYIINKQVYNVNGQAALTADLNFPASAWELKTSWLWIGTDEEYFKSLQNDGYYIVQAYYLDDNGNYQVGFAALSGMHVINRLTDDWVWSTFENVNNSKYTVTNNIPPTPMTNSTGPTAAAKIANTKFQQTYPALAQYELIGVQHQAGTEPILLASSQMESAFQSQSSCMACHGTAAYSVEKGYFNFALKEQGGIVYPTKMLPDSDFTGYNKLDFVWSLKRAQWKR